MSKQANLPIDAILRAELADPFAVFGMHETAGEVVVRAFLPWAHAVTVLDRATDAERARLEKIHPAGLFAGAVPGATRRFDYRLRVEGEAGTFVIEDAYRFPPVLGELDVYLLSEGSHLRSYEKLGANVMMSEGVTGVGFAVWAPSARAVSLVGDFNDWDGRRHPMRKHLTCGIWDIFIPDLAEGRAYKYQIKGADGSTLPLKADPYAAAAERPPATASVIAGPSHFAWSDQQWLAERAGRNNRRAPISIYEVHLGSWRRDLAEGGRYLTYRELADQLVPYAADMGFTHIQVMPVSEYPFDGSWGYQPVGLFAPTSRFGTPDDFRAFVDACHRAGLGLWVDWVPGHFPNDPHGLAQFDGTHLYDHADPRQGFHRDWNTLIYNYGRREVSNFLLSSAMHWLERYHVDGLRVDAVASMLYLDYSRQADDWIPNVFGGRENLEAIQFLRRMNQLVFADNSGATTAAEESTAWPMVSRPVDVGGLGFGFKWNMGWMHDTLAYMSQDPVHRKYHHNKMTFGLLYGFTENFILPLSHDEVVHGKQSLLGRMPGDRWQRFANLRAYFGFMWTHPGKKLLFMGGEFAQEREWNHDIGLDWHLLDDGAHRGVQALVRDLNWLYRSEPCLHVLDCEGEGFAWIDANDLEQSVLSFLRRGTDAGDIAVIVSNFTPMVRHGYRIGVPQPGRYLERLNTDAAVYGGSNVGNGGSIVAEPTPWHGQPCSLLVTLPPLATLILLPEH
ncbi:MAG TPA: 1,4-alpha-glucan branching protein GlgB [Stellaceae bacterium]|nr:1,4-alpha-glucan branching protein GlgB [Stellaceae bacterium]